MRPATCTLTLRRTKYECDGAQGTNGTKYTCEHAEFELGHGTGNLVLKRLEPETQLRLGARATGGGEGTLV